jgi:hypothetical protein
MRKLRAGARAPNLREPVAVDSVMNRDVAKAPPSSVMQRRVERPPGESISERFETESSWSLLRDTFACRDYDDSLVFAE